jgi:hypothetical protein
MRIFGRLTSCLAIVAYLALTNFCAMHVSAAGRMTPKTDHCSGKASQVPSAACCCGTGNKEDASSQPDPACRFATDTPAIAASDSFELRQPIFVALFDLWQPEALALVEPAAVSRPGRGPPGRTVSLTPLVSAVSGRSPPALA